MLFYIIHVDARYRIPDAPHAASLTFLSSNSSLSVNTEGSGVGKSNLHSVSKVQDLVEAARNGETIKLIFRLRLTERMLAVWETFLHQKYLYIQVPTSLLSGGSKEGFVALLEYAEEALQCTDIIVCMKKDRPDKAQLIRTFMFIGFTLLPPGHLLNPQAANSLNIYMRYSIV